MQPGRCCNARSAVAVWILQKAALAPEQRLWALFQLWPVQC
jgi:hypothetical protein